MSIDQKGGAGFSLKIIGQYNRFKFQLIIEMKIWEKKISISKSITRYDDFQTIELDLTPNKLTPYAEKAYPEP